MGSIPPLRKMKPGDLVLVDIPERTMVGRAMLKWNGHILTLIEYHYDTDMWDVLESTLSFPTKWLSAIREADRKTKELHHCPLCGYLGTPGFNMFECSNPGCRNYHDNRGEHKIRSRRPRSD